METTKIYDESKAAARVYFFLCPWRFSIFAILGSLAQFWMNFLTAPPRNRRLRPAVKRDNSGLPLTEANVLEAPVTKATMRRSPGVESVINCPVITVSFQQKLFLNRRHRHAQVA
jgi:hypothetical protein